MEKIDAYKKTTVMFFVGELVIFLSQIFIFFMVSLMVSGFLKNEDALEKFAAQKINSNSFPELGLTFFAIFLTVGIFVAVGKVLSNKYVDEYINEILLEIPRVIYFFGSSITGVMLSIATFANINPDTLKSLPSFIALTILFAVLAFLYGCAASYAFKRNTHILKNNIKNFPEKA